MMQKLLSLFMALLLVFGVCSCAGKTDGGTSDAEKSTEADTAAVEPSGTADAAAAEPSDTTTAEPEEISSPAQNESPKDFTSLVTLENERVEFCLPEDQEGGIFTDMGVTCVLSFDSYGNDVAAYHTYDDEGETVQKTVGSYTFDYQKFNHYGIEDWLMYVIRIVHNGEYYMFVYNVYASQYDDAQVEKFMETIRFLDP